MKWRTVLVVLLVGAGVLWGQRWRGGRGWGGYDNRDARSYGVDVPDWEVMNPAMSKDVFTFARLAYGGGRWKTDYPDSDLNFSWRLNQLTSLEVNPNPVVVDLDSDEVFDYPFVYMIEPGTISLSAKEEENLRKYCLNGGFLMVDDFWGEWEWEPFEWQMQRVFPGRKFVELEVDHPIFSAVFKLKEKPQVPAIETALRGRSMGITYESPYRHGPGVENVHYRALFDDEGRMMCMVCFNTDLGDGWEREGENHWYFKEFSEKWAYPMGINIIFYAMTH